jgi:hypothetical protein
MPKHISKRDSQSTKKLSKWDNAIADAQRLIHKLELAIATYQQNKAEGLPWPGDEASTQNGL